MIVSRIFFISLIAGIISGYSFEFGGYTVNAERIAIILVLPLLGLILTYKSAIRVPSISSKFLLFWIIWALLASYFSDEKSWALRQWITLASAGAFFFIIEQLNIDFVKKLNSNVVEIIGFIFGPVMALIYIVTVVGQTDFFNLSFVVISSDEYRLKATFLEPNIFGALLVPFLLLYLARYRFTLAWWSTFIGLNVSLLFTFSRGPWLAYILSIYLYFILIYPKKLSFNRVVKFLFLGASLGIVFSGFIYMLAGILTDDSVINRYHSILNRFYLYEIALVNLSNNPILGNGVYSFSMISIDEIHSVSIQEEGWIANIVLLVLHDTGIAGFALFCSFFILILYKGIKVTRNFIFINKSINKTSAALVSGGISLILSGMTIPTISLSIFWIYWAISDSYFSKSNKTIKLFKSKVPSFEK